MTRDDMRELLPLLALDALDPVTRAEVLAFVAQSPEAQEELREYLLAANAVAQAVPQVRPRPELRQRILAAATGRPAPDAAAEPSTRSVERQPQKAPPAAPARRGWSPWLAAAAVLVATVTSVGLYQTRDQLDDLRRTLAVWQERALEAERNVSTARATLAAYRRELDIMTADDLLLVALDGAPPAAGAEARAFVSRSRAAIVFTARNLPALPIGRTYQLWAVAGGQAISAGLFEPDAQGRGQIVADVPTLLVRPDALAVSIEPAGGVPAPTGPKVLVGVPTN